MDNLRGILIFLVVLCHFFEQFDGILKYRLYAVIYTFHMPLFVFISGYFAKYSVKKILTNLLYTYLIFQILYCLVAGENIKFLKPHWIMWYMSAMVIWYLTLPLLKNNINLILAMSVVFALMSGYITNLNFYLELSRVICFYPFFVFGFYMKDKKLPVFKVWAVLTAGLLIVTIRLILPYINTNWLYYTEEYGNGYTVFVRFLFMLMAVIWILALMMLIKDKKIPWLSTTGRYSICVYLLHGFIRYMPFEFFKYSDNINLLIAFALTFVVATITGNKITRRIIMPLTNLCFICKSDLVEKSK